MAMIQNIMIVLFIIPIVVLGLQVFFCLKRYKMALIFPIVVACFFILLGYYALILSLLMFAIYFIMQHFEKQKASNLSEITKMNIDDL